MPAHPLCRDHLADLMRHKESTKTILQTSSILLYKQMATYSSSNSLSKKLHTRLQQLGIRVHYFDIF